MKNLSTAAICLLCSFNLTIALADDTKWYRKNLGTFHQKTMRFKILPNGKPRTMSPEEVKFWNEVDAWFKNSWFHEATKQAHDFFKTFFGQNNNFQDSQKNCAQSGLVLADSAVLRALPLLTSSTTTDFFYWTSTGTLFNARTRKEEPMEDQNRIFQSFCVPNET